MKAELPAVAAIDIGSNAIRLAIARVGPAGTHEIVHNSRESVRLGQDVFSKGRISEKTMQAALDAFGRFRRQISAHSVGRLKAVATSAVREARNQEAFTSLIAKRHRIPISVITPDEEARLVHLAVKERVRLSGKPVLLVDIGGGSVEVSIGNKNGIISTESYAMGSVRLLQILGEGKGARFNQLVDRYVDVTKRRIREELGGRKVEVCIGTGGSIESLGEIGKALWKKGNPSRLTREELSAVMRKIQAMSVQERIERFGLRPDRADVISPAGVVLEKIVREAGVEVIIIPRVGVKDGLLAELVWENMNPGRHVDRDQVINSALQLGRKYGFDGQHGAAVSKIAVQIFDQMRAIHGLDIESRVILETASLLHDVGHHIGGSSHHKHSFYLIQSGPIIGLSANQLMLVANVARYHRKSLPNLEHEPYRTLSTKQRETVKTLAAILRVADAIDRQHAASVESVALTFRDRAIGIRMQGAGDMLLAKWALSRRADLFEEVFGKIVLEDFAARAARAS